MADEDWSQGQESILSVLRWLPLIDSANILQFLLAIEAD